MKEICSLFPYKYVHLGNDEVRVLDAWNKSKEVAKLKKTEGLSNNKEVQAYFMKQMEKILKKYNKDLITWNEAHAHSVQLPDTLSRFKLDSSSVMMQWAYPYGPTFQSKYILAAYGPLYYDIMGGSLSPYNFDYYAWLEKALKRPLTQQEKDNLWGLHGAMWTHVDRTEEKVQARVFPSHIATSELNWTRAENKNFEDFKKRLTRSNKRLEFINNIHYGRKTVADGPVLHYTFDNISGEKAVVDSLNRFNATLSASSLITDKGHRGKGLDMTVQGSKMILDEMISFTGEWTISMWVKLNAHTPYSYLACGSDGVTGLRLDQYGTANKVGFTQKGHGDYSFNYSCPTGVWTHLTFVGDLGSTQLYVNGKLKDTSKHTVTPPMYSIGSATNKQVINGTIDDLKFFRGALSPEKVAELAKE